MSFKDFIKFSWKKLVISIVIIFITLLSVFISGFFFQFGGSQPFIYYLFLGIAYILVLPLFFSLQIADFFIGTGMDYFIVIIGVILSPFYIYLLACLINLILEKNKNS